MSPDAILPKLANGAPDTLIKDVASSTAGDSNGAGKRSRGVSLVQPLVMNVEDTT